MDSRQTQMIDKFVAAAEAQLESLLDLSGEVLFSAAHTLREGDLYISCGFRWQRRRACDFDTRWLPQMRRQRISLKRLCRTV